MILTRTRKICLFLTSRIHARIHTYVHTQVTRVSVFTHIRRRNTGTRATIVYIYIYICNRNIVQYHVRVSSLFSSYFLFCFVFLLGMDACHEHEFNRVCTLVSCYPGDTFWYACRCWTIFCPVCRSKGIGTGAPSRTRIWNGSACSPSCWTSCNTSGKSISELDPADSTTSTASTAPSRILQKTSRSQAG